MSTDPDKLARARAHRKKYEESESVCSCSRPKVAMRRGSPVCAYCLAIETRKPPKKHYKPNCFALDSGDNFPLHLPDKGQEW